jgi:hypothetical protein
MTFEALAVVAVLAAGPVVTHVEVEADKAQAGAGDVTLTFHGEAESVRAGIRSERVVLPSGIAPGEVSLVKAPKGWKFTTAADGFTVAGPALRVGQDAEFAVRLARLPADATTLSFKTLETYGDGEIARWIELPQDGQPEPDHPAPTIKLKAAAKPAPSGSATTGAAVSPDGATPSPGAASNPAGTAASQIAADDAPESAKSDVAWWIAVAVAVMAAAAGLLFWRRRTASPR